KNHDGIGPRSIEGRRHLAIEAGGLFRPILCDLRGKVRRMGNANAGDKLGHELLREFDGQSAPKRACETSAAFAAYDADERSGEDQMIRVAFIVGDYPPAERRLREETAKSFSTAE